MEKNKLATPTWILEGFDSEADYNKSKGIAKEKKMQGTKSPTSSKQSKDSSMKGKTFNIRECPKCASNDVEVVIGEVRMWKCKKCGYKGREIKEKELTEDEFMKYLDEKGEEVS
jgi:ribosomal protein L37AE/L43A